MARNPALKILEDGEFRNMSPENFLQWLRALEHAPPPDQLEEPPLPPPDNDQLYEEPDDAFTALQMEVLGDTLFELRKEALDRERALLKRIRFLEESMCDGTTVKRGAIYDGRPGTMFYFDDEFRPTNEAAATRAKMLFDDGTWKSLVQRERSDDNVLQLPNIREWRRHA